MEPQQEDDDEVEQGADTQELASLNILVEVTTQIGVDEPEAENIPNFNEEVYAVTPELFQDTELIEIEPQQKENDEFNQDVVTQEPTSPEISVEILRQQEEINPKMDIIPHLNLGENEQM